MKNNKQYVITAAGGNGTAIQILGNSLSRARYAKRGKLLGLSMVSHGAEQAGFLIPKENRFEMAGGEFCGNAARSAAIPFSDMGGQSEVSFEMSGYAGFVNATVKRLGGKRYFVNCVFAEMPLRRKNVVLADGSAVSIVDLGGIVHVVIEESFPSCESAYRKKHSAVMTELGLNTRSAVGVLWMVRQGTSVLLYPVVWVKEVDSFFFEQSCGSGTIAVGLVANVDSVVQPTGQKIGVKIAGNTVSLWSEMEVVYEN